MKYFQGQLLEKDKAFKSDEYALKCQTSQLNEDLGLIDYIFSDKTGTLTKNNMVFKSLFAQGRRYGAYTVDSPTRRPSQARRTTLKSLNLVQDRSKTLLNEIAEGLPPKTVFMGANTDKPIIVDRSQAQFNPLTDLDKDPSDIIVKVCDELEKNRFQNKIFFDILTCCHEVIAKKEASGEKNYNASSPDELALLKFGNEIGYEFEGFDDHTNEIIVRNDYTGKDHHFKRLAMFRFSSDRGRMSIIVRDQQEGKYFMMAKGGDHIMINRSKNCQNFKLAELQKALLDYSQSGLRTLVYGYKELNENEVNEILKNLDNLEKIMGREKERRIAEYASDIETDLVLVGASAVEDELQDDVRGTLQSLRNADVKVWMLTGDKLETAINIGLSSGLLTTADKLLILKSETEMVSEEELTKFFRELHEAIHEEKQQARGVADTNKVCVALGGASFRVIYNDAKLKQEVSQIVLTLVLQVRAIHFGCNRCSSNSRTEG